MSAASTTRGVWQPAESALPLLCRSKQELDAVRHALEQMCRAWAADWGLDASVGGVIDCSPAQDVQPSGEDWQLLGSNGEAAGWLCLPAAFTDGIARQLFGIATASSPVASRIVHACRRDMVARCAAALRLPSGSGEPPPLARVTAWSGWVIATLPGEARLLLNAAAADGFISGTSSRRNKASQPALPPLVPLATAIGAAPCRLQIQLEECELDLGGVRDLRIGDVLRVRHPLDAPAHVRSAGGETLFSGYLARSRGRKAVELAPAPLAHLPA